MTPSNTDLTVTIADFEPVKAWIDRVREAAIRLQASDRGSGWQQQALDDLIAAATAPLEQP